MGMHLVFLNCSLSDTEAQFSLQLFETFLNLVIREKYNTY